MCLFFWQSWADVSLCRGCFFMTPSRQLEKRWKGLLDLKKKVVRKETVRWWGSCRSQVPFWFLRRQGCFCEPSKLCEFYLYSFWLFHSFLLSLRTISLKSLWKLLLLFVGTYCLPMNHSLGIQMVAISLALCFWRPSWRVCFLLDWNQFSWWVGQFWEHSLSQISQNKVIFCLLRTDVVTQLIHSFVHSVFSKHIDYLTSSGHLLP